MNRDDRQKAQRVRARIIALNPFEDNLNLLIREYASLCCCKRHHRVQVVHEDFLEQLSRRWVTELCAAYFLQDPESRQREAKPDDIQIFKKDPYEEGAILTKPDPSSTARWSRASAPTPDQDASRTREKALTEATARVPQGVPVSQTSYRPSQICPSPEPAVNLVNIAPAVTQRRQLSTLSPSQESSHHMQLRSETRPHFRPYTSSPNATVLSILSRPLTTAGSKTGSMYVFIRPSDPSHVKIGFTTTPVRSRLSRWKSSCLYQPQLVHRVDNVPNVKRVESLVQRELAIFRRKEVFCRHNKNCAVSHQEWFEVGIERASEVVDSWAHWMSAASPYEEDGTRNLRPEWSTYLATLSPAELLSAREALVSRISVPGSDKTARPESSSRPPLPLAVAIPSPAQRLPTQSSQTISQSLPPLTRLNTPAAFAKHHRLAMTRTPIDKEEHPSDPSVSLSRLWRRATTFATASSRLCKAVFADGSPLSAGFQREKSGNFSLVVKYHPPRASGIGLKEDGREEKNVRALKVYA